MTDFEALHRAILDHPDDDAPRLIFADALDDACDSARAAFIGLQVATDRVPEYEQIAIHFRYRNLRELGGWPLGALPESPGRCQCDRTGSKSTPRQFAPPRLPQ